MLFIVPQYDIIHFHTTPGRSIMTQLPIFLYSLLWKKRIIIHIHVGNQILDYKNDKIFKFVLQKATKVVVLANVIKDMMTDIYNIDSYVLYNPIEEQATHSNTKVANIIFLAAYLTKNKGYDTLLKAFKKIVSEYSDWQLVLAGTGETEKAKRLINELNIDKNVTLYNWLNKEQMRAIYNRTAIYCIASKQEGFPISFLEAASYGIPIVTTPVGGLVDIIENENNCMIFNFDDENELYCRIKTLIECPKLREKISKNLQLLVKNKFSIETIDKEINTLYKNIIQNHVKYFN